MNNFKLVMRKFIIFDNGSINPFGTLEEEVHNLEKEYTHIIQYIHSPCYRNKHWVTRFFLVEVDSDDVTIQEEEVTDPVKKYLESRGYTGGLTCTSPYEDKIILYMYKEKLSKNGKRGKGSCDFHIITDLDKQQDEIRDFIQKPSPIGNKSETAFRVEKIRKYTSLGQTDELMKKEVTGQVEQYLGVKCVVITDNSSMFDKLVV